MAHLAPPVVKASVTVGRRGMDRRAAGRRAVLLAAAAGARDRGVVAAAAGGGALPPAHPDGTRTAPLTRGSDPPF